MKRIACVVMLLLAFSVAAFATTTAVPKSDTAAVVTRSVKIELSQQSLKAAYRVDRAEAARPDLQRSTTIYENQHPVASPSMGYG